MPIKSQEITKFHHYPVTLILYVWSSHHTLMRTKVYTNILWNLQVQAAGAHAGYTTLLLSNSTNRHIACLCYGSPQLQTTNLNFGVVFFWTQQGMFSAALNELSRFKLDVRRNMARYVLSNSKLFGLFPKTLRIPRTSPSEVRRIPIWNQKVAL